MTQRRLGLLPNALMSFGISCTLSVTLSIPEVFQSFRVWVLGCLMFA